MRKRISTITGSIGLILGLAVIGGSVVGGIALATDRGGHQAPAVTDVSDSTTGTDTGTSGVPGRTDDSDDATGTWDDGDDHDSDDCDDRGHARGDDSATATAESHGEDECAGPADDEHPDDD